MRKFLLSTLFAAFLFFPYKFVIAQRTCASYEYNQSLIQSDQQYAQNQQQIERFTSEFIRNGGGSPVSSFRGATVIQVYSIPVVVHVIYNTAVQNISNTQIQSQIDVLNKDYQMLNKDIAGVPDVFKPLCANFNIKFCLASIDPNGNPTTGIIRKQTTKVSFSSNNAVKFSSKGGDDAWPATQYLNIWVCNLKGGLLGYAQFPGGPGNTDGVVILYSAFGNTGFVTAPYDKGRTATHEIGHWLNLRHIWGDDNGACTGSDLVDDTPNQGDANFGCPKFPHISCSNGPNGDLFMNFMDYTDDACMFMFTNGQRIRALAVLQPGGARYAVTQSGKCGSTYTLTATVFSGTTAPSNLHISIYPQPANTYTNIQFNSNWKGNITITVMNEIGAVVAIKQTTAESRIYKLNVSSLKNGVYYIQLHNNNELINQKIIIQH